MGIIVMIKLLFLFSFCSLSMYIPPAFRFSSLLLLWFASNSLTIYRVQKSVCYCTSRKATRLHSLELGSEGVKSSLGAGIFGAGSNFNVTFFNKETRQSDEGEQPSCVTTVITLYQHELCFIEQQQGKFASFPSLPGITTQSSTIHHHSGA